MFRREKLIILGTGGRALDIAALAKQTRKFTTIGYLDDNRNVGEEVNGLPVLGRLTDAKVVAEARRSRFLFFRGSRPRFISGIASSKFQHERPQIIQATGLPDEAFATLIHPSSRKVMDKTVVVEQGAVIFPFVTLMNNTRIGKHSLVFSHVSVGHDTKIGNFCTLTAGVKLAGTQQSSS